MADGNEHRTLDDIRKQVDREVKGAPQWTYVWASDPNEQVGVVEYCLPDQYTKCDNCHRTIAAESKFQELRALITRDAMVATMPEDWRPRPSGWHYAIRRFCGLQCLKEWVGSLDLTKLKTPEEVAKEKDFDKLFDSKEKGSGR